MNLKKNKTKITAVAVLLLVLISSTLSFVGCDYETPYGYYDPHDFPYHLSSNDRLGGNLQMYAISNTDIFNIDDVTFELLYGTHANKYIGRQDLKYYEAEDYPYYNDTKYGGYVFAIYVCRYEYMYEFPKCLDEISNASNHDFLTKIPESEVFSENYGYILRQNILLKNFYFKHKEEITIPKEYFDKQSGEFIIKIFCILNNSEDNTYESAEHTYIILNYEKVDEDTIKIDFNRVT